MLQSLWKQDMYYQQTEEVKSAGRFKEFIAKVILSTKGVNQSFDSSSEDDDR